MNREEKIVFTTGIDVMKKIIEELESELLYIISKFENNPTQEQSFYITALTRVILKLKNKVKEIEK